MLKLIYNTGVFGPIDLEYFKPVIRVGSSEDNDLVLRHSSVQPHHGLLVFRGETVLLLPPSDELPSETDLLNLSGTGHGAGEQLWIGDLQFSLAHSSNSMALPDALEEATDELLAEPKASANGAKTEPRYYCPKCQVFVPGASIKRIGLVGQPKIALCQKCGQTLKADPASPPKSALPANDDKNTKKGLGGMLKEIMKGTSRISVA